MTDKTQSAEPDVSVDNSAANTVAAYLQEHPDFSPSAKSCCCRCVFRIIVATPYPWWSASWSFCAGAI